MNTEPDSRDTLNTDNLDNERKKFEILYYSTYIQLGGILFEEELFSFLPNGKIYSKMEVRNAWIVYKSARGL